MRHPRSKWCFHICDTLNRFSCIVPDARPSVNEVLQVPYGAARHRNAPHPVKANRERRISSAVFWHHLHAFSVEGDRITVCGVHISVREDVFFGSGNRQQRAENPIRNRTWMTIADGFRGIYDSGTSANSIILRYSIEPTEHHESAPCCSRLCRK